MKKIIGRVAGALLALALLYVMLWWEIRLGGNAWLIRYLGASGPQAVRSVVSLLFFCGIYLLHYRSYRSMRLLGLKAPLKEGDRFPLTLKFEKAGEVKVEVVVESVQGGPAKHAH